MARGLVVRVLLVGTGVEPIPPTGYGGVERTIAELARALEGAGASVEVYQQVRHRRRRDEYPFAWGLPREVRRRAYDVLHASTPVVANRLAWAGLPFVYTTHSRHWFDASGLRGRYGRWLERRAVRRARATVALTEPLRARLVGALGRDPGRDRLAVIPIGVDTERFRPEPAARNGRRAIGVGVVAPVKRWELAARAVAGSPFSLRIVGPLVDPAYAQRVRAAGGGQVELVGEVSEEALARALGESDVMVHPSAVELLAGAVLQGLASGLPVLGAAPVAGLLEAGTTGWATSESDPEGIVEFLADGLRRLAEPERRAAMGAAARRTAIERFGWPAVARAHLELYSRLLASPPRSPGS